MNVTIHTLLATALLVTAGAVHAAEGEYYQGASAGQPAMSDRVHTGSIAGEASAQRLAVGKASATINSGDYWEGANRPNSRDAR